MTKTIEQQITEAQAEMQRMIAANSPNCDRQERLINRLREQRRKQNEISARIQNGY